MFNKISLIAGLVATAQSALVTQEQLPLQTEGSRIVDNNGDLVRLACVNWYGAHMERFVVNGLDEVDIDVLSKNITDFGFNCVRLVFSLEMFYDNPVVADDAVSANPQLQGMTAMEVFDATVESLTNAGAMIILNNHISDAMWCCGEWDDNGLWHNADYSADQWIGTLKAFTTRYQDNLFVIGNDLRNEIRADRDEKLFATWGDGNVDTDWKLAATTAGNEILAENPNQLIFVEGLNYANDMSPIRDSPISLDVSNRLVYSFHIYSWQYVTSFRNYDKFRDGLDKDVTYMLEEGQDYTAPVWVGEFGDNQQDKYWRFLIQYFQERPTIGWAYWAYNGYQHTPDDDESFGIMDSTMTQVRDAWKLSDLQSVMDPAMTLNDPTFNQ